MIAAMNHDRRTALRELFAWLECHDFPMQVSVRPFCRVHRDTLMSAGTTQNGQTRYYCSKCKESLKVRPRVV